MNELVKLDKLFNWLVVGQILRINPTHPVKSPKHTDKLDRLRDRALIAVMIYSYARISAAVGSNVKDTYSKQHRLWIHILEKGSLELEVPYHHNLERYLREHIEAAGIPNQPNTPLLRSISKTGLLMGERFLRQNTWGMVKYRAKKSRY